MTSPPETPACGPSSAGLKANVANFLERAERIASDPLAGTDPQFKVRMYLDLRNGEVGARDFDMMTLPEDDWLIMALKMRPIIFTETDDISIPRLTAQIEREHVPLRGSLKQARAGLAAWKKHAFVYAGNLGGLSAPLSQGEVREQYVRVGPPGSPPSGVSVAGLPTDFYYANTYLNSVAWHSDTDKFQEYQAANDRMKLHYRKCAEIRVLSAAKDIIPPLYQWILDARAAGHDL